MVTRVARDSGPDHRFSALWASIPVATGSAAVSTHLMSACVLGVIVGCGVHGPVGTSGTGAAVMSVHTPALIYAAKVSSEFVAILAKLGIE